MGRRRYLGIAIMEVRGQEAVGEVTLDEAGRRQLLDDVQAGLRVFQDGKLLIDVHQADLIRVGSLAHQVDHLLQQARAFRKGLGSQGQRFTSST